MPAIDSAASSEYYEEGRKIMAKMFERGEFVLVDDSPAAKAAFEGCLLNCGMLMHAHAYGGCVNERMKARQQQLLKSTADIADLVGNKHVAASAFKSLLTHNNAWILSCMQAHLTKINFDNLSTFVVESFYLGITKFRAEDEPKKKILI